MNTINKHRATPKALGQKIVYSIVFVCENYSGPFTINKFLGAFSPPGGSHGPPSAPNVEAPEKPHTGSFPAVFRSVQPCFARLDLDIFDC